MDEPLRVEATEAAEFGPCECCGAATRRVWGFVHGPEESFAAYFVQWAVQRLADHGAVFDLILGQRDGGDTAADRVLVSLAYRLDDTGPSFMVIESSAGSAAGHGAVGRALSRAEVVGQPIAGRAFPMADAVLGGDGLVAELLGLYRMGPGVQKPWWRFWR